MKKLNLGENHFEGSLDLTRLPDGIEEMYLYSNRFSGSIDLTPMKLQRVDVERNELRGTVRLPPNIHIRFDKNDALTVESL